MGGDPESAGACGVPIERLATDLYVASGAAAALLGLSEAILCDNARLSAAHSFIFDSAITAVIDGVFLTEGIGSVPGIVVGTPSFAFVDQEIYFTKLDANWTSLVVGAPSLLAVFTNNAIRKMAFAHAPRAEGDRPRPFRPPVRGLGRDPLGRGAVSARRQRGRPSDPDQDPLGLGPAELGHDPCREPAAAQAVGIATVHGSGGIFPLVTIGRSSFVGREPARRVESSRLFDRARALAVAFEAPPWFWSEQWDLPLRVVGLRDAARRDVRGALPEGGLLRFGLDAEGRVLAAAAVGPASLVGHETRFAERLTARAVICAPELLAYPRGDPGKLLRV